MKHIYCISGLGADERVFSKLIFPGCEAHFISWIIPQKNEHISSYAKKLIQNIHHDNPILLGLSFGGMMCIEIAKQIAAEKIILISSVRHFTEIPLWMRLAGKLKLNKNLPMKSFKIIEPLEDYNLGVETRAEKELVKFYRKNINQQYADWAIDNLINWNNTWTPKNLHHVHGGRDRIFPIKNVKPDYIISSGGHLMVMNRFDEVNKYINLILGEN